MKYNLSSLKSLSHKFDKSFCLLVLFTIIFDFLLFNVFLYTHRTGYFPDTWRIAIITLIIVLLFSYFILRRKQWTFWVILIITIIIGHYYLLKISKDFQFFDEINGFLSWVVKYRFKEILIVTLNIVVFVYFLKILIQQITLSRTKVDSMKADANTVQHIEHLKSDANTVQHIEHLKLATPLRRLLAAIIDIFISMIPLFINMLSFQVMLYLISIGNIEGALLFPSLMILLEFLFLIFGIIHIVLMVRRSQTIGKYLMNVYVIDIGKEKRIGFWKYLFVREIFGKTLVVGLFVPLWQNPAGVQIIETLAFIGAFIWIPYFIIDNLLIFRKNHVTVHDEIADTKVFYLPEDKKRKKLLDFSKI